MLLSGNKKAHMLSSVVDFFTPGGRRRSGQANHVEQDADVKEDVVQDVAQNVDQDVGNVQENDVVQDAEDVADVKLAPTVLFDKEFDEKHVDIDRDFDVEYSDVSGSSSLLRRRKGLPKIEYSKLVVLSRTNFSQYRESIKVLGYSRQWPTKYAEPTLRDLKEEWDGRDCGSLDDVCRREAYLVLYSQIPLALKYLVRNVKNGDVIALWKVLYNRFLHVTDVSLKAMKQEWEMLSMSKLKVSLDEFISVVATKANDLRMVGEIITKKDEAVALVCGLTSDYSWIKSFFATKAQYSFAEVVEEAMKFASDNKLFKDAQVKEPKKPAVDNREQGEDEDAKVCVWFNKDQGCRKGDDCKFIHKVSGEKLTHLLKKVAGQRGRSGNALYSSTMKTTEADVKKYCFKCGDKDHLADVCPLKTKINDYIKTLKSDAGRTFVSVEVPFRL